jgi:parallel beta-helix repeat protein
MNKNEIKDSKDKLYIILFIILLLNFSIDVMPVIHSENSATGSMKLYVGGSGQGNYSTIQHAINNASCGDTVFVYSGIYYENLIIDKSINLIGENKDSTIIDGGNSGDVPCIDICSDNVIVQGFKIQWSDWEFHEAGLNIKTGNVKIIDNNVSIHDKGILLLSGAKNCIIEQNILFNNHEGIYIWPSASGGHVIKNNRIFNNDYGFKIFDAVNLIIKNNTVFDNNWYGILMKTTEDSKIFQNTFEENSQAISVGDQCFNNLFFHNNFISNNHNVIDEGLNSWNKDYPCGGNYWSEYIGVDEDGDGIGDEIYNVPGNPKNLDHYPFIFANKWEDNPLKTRFLTPSYGFTSKKLQFNCIIEGGISPYQVQWDFGDGITSNFNNTNHTYSEHGIYNIILYVQDECYNTKHESSEITIYSEDLNPPKVLIKFPEKGIYINNTKIIDFPLTLIFGAFFVQIEANDYETIIQEIQIIIDDNLMTSFNSSCVKYDWPQSMKGYHILKIRAIDLAGNIGDEEIAVFNIGL